MDLAGEYRIFHPAIAQYTFFSAAHGTFSKVGHILGHKHKKIEITPYILSDHNTLNYNSTTKAAAENMQTIGG
jgi:hypothetical protein